MIYSVVLVSGIEQRESVKHIHIFPLFYVFSHRGHCGILSRISCVKSYLTLCDPMDCSLSDSSVRGDSPEKNTGVGCYALLQGIFPTQGSNPGLPHCRWILYSLNHQGSPRILEWEAYPFSRATSQPRIKTGVSCIVG